MTRLAAAAAAAALALPASAVAADRTARYSVEMRVDSAQPVLVSGTGTLAADRRLASLTFVMHTTGKKKTGDAVIDARRTVVAYLRGPDTGAPASKPWAAFSGTMSMPFFDPGVAVRLAPTAHGARHVHVTVPRAEAVRLFPSAPAGQVIAELWLDARGRVQRLHASAREKTQNLLITLDERITSYGGPAAISVPPKNAVYMHLP